MKAKRHRRTCFLLMPFSAPFNEYYKKIYKPAIEAAGFNCLRADEISSARPFIEDILTSIKNSDLVLAEVTGRNPNVMYEMGIAYASKTPMIIVSQSASEAPTDLKHQRIIIYNTTQPSWAATLKAEITKTIIELMRETHVWSIDHVRPKSGRNIGQPWTASDVRNLRQLAKRNTPTRVIGLKLGRTSDSVRRKASEEGISLKPTNKPRVSRKK